ncbi:MAG: metallophosphoesterase [Candidatus Thermoplasmatota archaeon]|nr:metallophosphoesterase [Candidatus Thermoplasmatota archaeon]
MRIAHISDIHYSKSWMFLHDMLDECIEMLNEESPDIVIITGDITDYGLQAEFEGVKEEFRKIKTPYFIVPGNHDSRHEGYKKFEEFFGKRFFVEEVDEYTFIGLDSSEPDIDEGHVGREQLQWLQEKLLPNAVVFLHHHLVPIPHTGRERNVLVDAGEVMKILDMYKVPLVLSGHKHVPWVWKINNTVVSTAGTVSCERTGSGQSFDIIELGDKAIMVNKVNIRTKKREKYEVLRKYL